MYLVFNKETWYIFQSSVFICECMVNQAKKAGHLYAIKILRNTSQKQYKCIKLSQVKIWIEIDGGMASKNLPIK